MRLEAVALLGVLAVLTGCAGGARAPDDDEGSPVVLSRTGIGAFPFGSPPDEVVVGLTLRWGPPDTDSGWVPAGSSPYGVCPGQTVRAVSWRGFTVLFSDGATAWGMAGNRHLFRWEYRVDDPPRPGPEVRVDPAAREAPGARLAGGGDCGR